MNPVHEIVVDAEIARRTRLETVNSRKVTESILVTEREIQSVITNRHLPRITAVRLLIAVELRVRYPEHSVVSMKRHVA